MVRLLVRDLFRRSRSDYALGFNFLMLAWLFAERGQASRALAMASTLCGVAYLGPMLAFSRLAPKEILLLPVSRREIWQARWVVAALVAGGTAVAAHSVASALMWLGHDTPIDLASLALTATCVFAYAGALMCLLPLTEVARRVPFLRRMKSLHLTLHLVVVALFGGGVFWPAVFHDRLPVVWGDVQGSFGLVLAAGVALAFAGSRYRPAIRAYSVSMVHAPPAAHASRWVPMLTDRLTGLAKLAWLEVTRTGAALAFMLLIVGGIFVGMDLLTGSSDGSLDSLADLGLLPFDRGLPAGMLALLLGTMALGMRDLDIGPNRTDLLRTSLRYWRTLPMSRNGVAGILVARRLLGWLLLWAMLLALQAAAFGAPPSWRLDLLMFFAGLDALAFATRLLWVTFTPRFGQIALVGGPSLALAAMLREFGGPETLVLYTAGSLALGLAWLVQTSALGRSQTYLSASTRDRGLSGDMATEG